MTTPIDISPEAVESALQWADIYYSREDRQNCDALEALSYEVRRLRTELTARAERITALEDLLRREPAEAHTTMWQKARRAALAEGETK